MDQSMQDPTAGQDPSADPAEDSPADASEDAGSTSIELNIKADGTMTVSLEQGDQESEGQEAPAKDLKDAIRMITQMAQSILSGASSADAGQEDAAYKNEMASPTM